MAGSFKTGSLQWLKPIPPRKPCPPTASSLASSIEVQTLIESKTCMISPKCLSPFWREHGNRASRCYPLPRCVLYESSSISKSTLQDCINLGLIPLQKKIARPPRKTSCWMTHVSIFLEDEDDIPHPTVWCQTNPTWLDTFDYYDQQPFRGLKSSRVVHLMMEGVMIVTALNGKRGNQTGGNGWWLVKPAPLPLEAWAAQAKLALWASSSWS